MTMETVTLALRWTFWSLLYLAVALMALLLCLGSMAPYLPVWARWTAFGVFAAGIAVDVRSKTRTDRPRRPDVPGESVRVTRRP
ncbi:hypothetical protein G7075_12260 [Phycicoccus sp. HDW14]|uniref:hypothetical protein n=1 Tax=Phycicoccus sp. HDW14 TaxID=2714941 RepID=UPI0014094DA6|nr:hypothetical protein [Phycicoccus sp. HDW14]QIM21719.1 hypothetical protein G7075_12260 [Phycicoccus sp. HDW14]